MQFSKSQIAQAVSILLSGDPKKVKKAAERQILYWQESDWVVPEVKGDKGVPALYSAADSALLVLAGYMGFAFSKKDVLEATFTRISIASHNAGDVLKEALIAPMTHSQSVIELEYMPIGGDNDLPGFFNATWVCVDPDGEEYVDGGSTLRENFSPSPFHIRLDLNEIMMPLRQIAGLEEVSEDD